MPGFYDGAQDDADCAQGVAREYLRGVRSDKTSTRSAAAMPLDDVNVNPVNGHDASDNPDVIKSKVSIHNGPETEIFKLIDQFPPTTHAEDGLRFFIHLCGRA